ncbi:60S ribosomal L6-like [Olea europaea subsp. europaea]|uniref:60S ribosomal L6-like n=1 Tax=Olea europaea subsp. europaea TaxID=158383 RepID=A0A8S0V050_OLEEU|nr:60S ribosomal L6-like [Olea europaea subsp. europaea]
MELIHGVRKRSHSQKYHKRGLWAIKAKNEGKFPTHKKKSVAAEPATDKAPKFDLAGDVNKPLSNTITPRTMLIMLIGRFKRTLVVFLNQLASGLLLVTGPFKINGVPLRCVNQAYIIATSTKVDISGVNVEKFDDKYFAKQAEKKKKAKKKDDQKAVDAELLKAIESVPELKFYLGARFSLKAGMKPHELVF